MSSALKRTTSVAAADEPAAKRYRPEVQRAIDEVAAADRKFKGFQQTWTDKCLGTSAAQKRYEELQADFVVETGLAETALNTLKTANLTLAKAEHHSAAIDRFWELVTRFLYDGECHLPCGEQHKIWAAHHVCFDHDVHKQCVPTCVRAVTTCPGCFAKATPSFTAVLHVVTKGECDEYQTHVRDTDDMHAYGSALWNQAAEAHPVFAAVGACKDCSALISVFFDCDLLKWG